MNAEKRTITDEVTLVFLGIKGSSSLIYIYFYPVSYLAGGHGSRASLSQYPD